MAGQVLATAVTMKAWREEKRREGGSWPHKIAEGDRGGERGGLFKRGANEYSEERGLRAPR